MIRTLNIPTENFNKIKWNNTTEIKTLEEVFTKFFEATDNKFEFICSIKKTGKYPRWNSYSDTSNK